MKRIARTVLCLVLTVASVLPTVAAARPYKPAPMQDPGGCAEGDLQCYAETYEQALMNVKKFIRDVTAGSKPLIAQLSKMAGVELTLDQNFQVKFRNAYPTLAAEIEKNVQSKYGFKLPYIPPKITGVETAGLIIAGVATAVYCAQMWDDYVNENIIDWMVNDLTSRGWTQEQAQKEANFTWATTVAPMTQLFVPIVGHLGNLFTGLDILGSGEYYSAHELLNRRAFAYFRDGKPETTKPPRQDNGRSYIEWAMRREGSMGVGMGLTGGVGGCSVWVWRDPYIVNTYDENGNLVTTLHDGHWECVR